MIRKLRVKFIVVTAGTLALVFAVVFIMLNAFMQNASARQTEILLEFVAANDGRPFPQRGGVYPPATDFPPEQPPFQNAEFMRAARFFYVKVDKDGDLFETNYEMMSDFNEEDAFSIARTVIEKNRAAGTVGNMQYLAAAKEYGTIIVFAERSIEIQLLSQLTSISIRVAGGTCAVMLVFTVFLSNWAVRPVRDAFDRQRRFIADASHELKTPLTVVAANLDVLDNEIGGNERLARIKSQISRMGALIHDLLTLAKVDEGDARKPLAMFDLRRAILSTTLEFESRAFEEGKQFHYRLDDEAEMMGDESQIKQLTSILIDNAIRYSNKNGIIEIVLNRENGRYVLSVYNTGNGIPAAERDRVFDRFYRSDDSRSRETGGYGLGLSIARELVNAHKGKIAVTGKTGEWVRFSVTL